MVPTITIQRIEKSIILAGERRKKDCAGQQLVAYII